MAKLFACLHPCDNGKKMLDVAFFLLCILPLFFVIIGAQFLWALELHVCFTSSPMELITFNVANVCDWQVFCEHGFAQVC